MSGRTDAPKTDAQAPSGSLTGEGILLAGHGSRREKSNEQVRELAAALETRLDVPVDAGFLELADPSIGEAVDGSPRPSRR